MDSYNKTWAFWLLYKLRIICQSNLSLCCHYSVMTIIIFHIQLTSDSWHIFLSVRYSTIFKKEDFIKRNKHYRYIIFFVHLWKSQKLTKYNSNVYILIYVVFHIIFASKSFCKNKTIWKYIQRFKNIGKYS